MTLKDYRQQMNQVLVCIQPGWDLLELDQLIDMAVKRLELLDIHLIVFHIVWHGLVDGNQVFEMDTKDGDFKTCTSAVSLSVVVKVSAGGQQVCHLIQYLGNKIHFLRWESSNPWLLNKLDTVWLVEEPMLAHLQGRDCIYAGYYSRFRRFYVEEMCSCSYIVYLCCSFCQLQIKMLCFCSCVRNCFWSHLLNQGLNKQCTSTW